MDEIVALAVGDASFANVGDEKTRSQAGLMVLLADNRSNEFRNNGKGSVNAMSWRSHKIKRVVRSTLAAETMAALEATEEADLVRAHLAELHHQLDTRDYYDDLKCVPMIHLTDCKSLYDLLHHRGTVPSERRLLLDIEALREQIELFGQETRWVNTKQMLADCLTKDDVRAGDYMRRVIRTSQFSMTEDPTIDAILHEQKALWKARRRAYYEAKYPQRKREADPQIDVALVDFEMNGWHSINGCYVEVANKTKVYRRPPNQGLRWRLTLGITDDDQIELLEKAKEWQQPGLTGNIDKPMKKIVSIFGRRADQVRRLGEQIMKNETEDLIYNETEARDENGMTTAEAKNDNVTETAVEHDDTTSAAAAINFVLVTGLGIMSCLPDPVWHHDEETSPAPTFGARPTTAPSAPGAAGPT